MVQEIIVYVIGGLLAMYIAWRTARMLSGKAQDPCAGCGGCPQRDEFRKKQQQCAGKGKNPDKGGNCK